MRVLPLEPFGGDDPRPDGRSSGWEPTTEDAVRDAAVGLLPFALEGVVWSADPDLGRIGRGRTPRGEARVVVVTEVLDARRFVLALDRAATALRESDAVRSGVVVLADEVADDVRGAVALVGPGVVRVFLVQLDPSEPAAPTGAPLPGPDATAPETPGTPALTSARGRRRGRAAVPALAPREQLGVVAALVGETELTLDGTGGEIRAVLGAEGLIRVDQETFEDPLEAAVAQGREVSDGWAAWRFGVDGPYLGEALEEALNPQARARRVPRRRAVQR